MVSVLTLAMNVPSAPAEGVTALTLWTSVRSTSVKAIVPAVGEVADRGHRSVTAPVTSATATTGASLVPVMVIVTFCVTRCPPVRR